MSHVVGLHYPFKSLWRRMVCHITPAITAFALGALAIMVFDRAVPFVQTWGEIVPPIVMAGQEVAFQFKLYKLDNYDGKIVRWIVDANGLIFNIKDSPTVGGAIPFNEEKEISRSFPIPCGISVGPATYHSEAVVYVWWNLVQRFIWPVRHEVKISFTVKQGLYAGQCSRDTPGVPGPIGPQGPRGAAGENAPTPK